MQMFSIPIETGNNVGASLPAGMERVTTLVQPIEFEPNECTALRREYGAEFSKELV